MVLRILLHFRTLPIFTTEETGAIKYKGQERLKPSPTAPDSMVVVVGRSFKYLGNRDANIIHTEEPSTSSPPYRKKKFMSILKMT